MDAPLKAEKSLMRKQLRQVRNEFVQTRAGRLAPDYARLASGAEEMLAWFFRKTATPIRSLVISSFRPEGSEINPQALELALQARGHRLVWPRVEEKIIRFYAADGSPPFVRSSFGLLEPGPQATELAPELILAPLIGFDANGFRLGQGGGFYDQALERLAGHSIAVGLAWECQQVSKVPVAPYDQPLAGVLTPEKFYRFETA